MNLLVFVFVAFAAGLLLLFAWALLVPRRTATLKDVGKSLEESGERHALYFPQIRQAMDQTDFAFLTRRGSGRLAQRVRKERRRIVIKYLSFLNEDFQRLLRLARVIAVLSPEVAAAQELERLRLSVIFSLRWRMIRLKLFLGFAPLPELRSLSEVVSGLAVRLEMAMKELGERAALAAELASSLDRSGLGRG